LRILLSIVFEVDTKKMRHLNNTTVTASATLIMRATIIVVTVSSMATIITTPVAASATTMTPTPSPGIELSPQPLYQERSRLEGQTQINQTQIKITFSGNGTLNLPNSTETIRTTSIGSGISSLIDGSFAGQVILTTEDGRENATATVYEIGQFNAQDLTGRGIAIAVFHTNSTGKLAPLDDMILAGQDEFLPDGGAFITYWEWNS
jgi:hypothetical protein